MTRIITSIRGNTFIFIAIGLTSVLAMLSVSMSVVQNLRIREQINRINRFEAFYANELGVWHYFSRQDTGITDCVERSDHKHCRIKVENASSPLIRRYDSKNLETSLVDKGDRRQICGHMYFEKRGFRNCLSLPSPPGVLPSIAITHRAIKLIDFRARYRDGSSTLSTLLQPDGKLILIGGENARILSSFESSPTWQLARLNTDGTIDRSFGDHGKVTTNVGNHFRYPYTGFADNDKIVVVGLAQYGGQNSTPDLSAIRYLSDGKLDEAFGTGGVVHVKVPGTEIVGKTTAAARANTGKFIMAATINVDRDTDLALVQLSAHGVIDTSFGDNGIVKTDLVEKSSEILRALTIQPDGKIVAAGNLRGPTDSTPGQMFIVRYFPDGKIDTLFGSSGKALLDFKMADLSKVLILKDNRILGVGKTANKSPHADHDTLDNAVFLLTPDGKVDESFGEKGIVIADYATGTPRISKDNWLYTVLPLKSGFFLASGFGQVTSDWSENQAGKFLLTRFTVNGSLDSQFGSNGFREIIATGTTYIGGDPMVTVLLETPEGKIVVVGYNNESILVQRLLSDFTKDDGFGSNSLVSFRFGSSLDIATRVVFDASEKIVVSGFAAPGFPDSRVVVARLNASFDLDSTFGGKDVPVSNSNPEGLPGRIGPWYSTEWTNAANIADGMAIQPDGKIVVGGQSAAESFFAVRYLPDGTIDPSFGNKGFSNPTFHCRNGDGSMGGAQALALQQDGKILLGNCEEMGQMVMRLQKDGAIDTGFGKNGMSLSFPEMAQTCNILGLLEQSDRKIVAAGWCELKGQFEPKRQDFALARLNSDGSLDPGFGKDGFITTDFDELTKRPRSGRTMASGSGMGGGISIDLANTVSIQPDGKIIAAGCGGFWFSAGSMRSDSERFQSALARYNSNGTLDNSFGKDGKVLIDFSPYFKDAVIGDDDCIYGMALLPDGRILIAPTPKIPSRRHSHQSEVGTTKKVRSDILLVVLKPDGTLDTSVGDGGVFITPSGGRFHSIKSVAVSPNGLIALAGDAVFSWFEIDFLVDIWQVSRL